MTDLDIARQCTMYPIEQIAQKLDLHISDIECYGPFKAKISNKVQKRIESNPTGQLILVTAMSPTPAGEGKTTTSVGLCDALNRIGKKTVVCLREPSLGPNFGMKGGAAGGGYSQVVPMEDINLHFTGDFHAITTAHNLLAAMLDNHIHHGNSLQIDVRCPTWNRVVDLNDRALRSVVIGLGGTTGGIPRQSSFDITVASEIMAIFCLSESIFELKERLGKMIIAYSTSGEPILALQLRCHGAMAAILKDALKPNLVQTLEGNPAIIHGGPFANIAHGCNSVLATKLGLKLADYVVTEAGFGADLGAEKFFDIKCRKAGLTPKAAVLVATIRALKYHGGVEKSDLSIQNLVALNSGFGNLRRHAENLKRFGIPVIVAINQFPTDTKAEIDLLIQKCSDIGLSAVLSEHWAHGGAGAESLAKMVASTVETSLNSFEPLYSDDLSLLSKIETICKTIYGASGIVLDKNVTKKLSELESLGFGTFPICMAKTQYSFSADPNLRGEPDNFTIPIRDVKVSAGAGFVVVLTGEIMTMPGLPKSPASERIDIADDGEIVGLF
ncbi:MAG: formate--tetrahydrofolate ligase [Thermoguttaceae bacterium]